MAGRGLASLAALAAIFVVGSSSASGQENPVLDPESVNTVIPWSVGEQLAARGEDIDDLSQRHPWVPNDAPLPLNYTYMQGSWRNADGSTVVVYCLLDVAAEHPDWEQENMLKTWAAGGVRCNVRLNEAAGGAMTGTIRGLNHPSGAQLASAGLGSQHAVPAGQGSGWQAFGVAEFNRSSMNSNQQVKLEARLVLPNWAGATNAGWNSIGNGCTRGSNQREVNCELWSPPFQNVPYPCPSGKVGVQPPECNDQPKACDIASGHYGIQPNCFTLPSVVQEEIEDTLADPDAEPAPESTAPGDEETAPGPGDDVPIDGGTDAATMVPDGDPLTAAAQARHLDCGIAAGWRRKRRQQGGHFYYFNSRVTCVGNAPPPTITGRATLYRWPRTGSPFVAELGDYYDNEPTYFAYSDGLKVYERRKPHRVQHFWVLDAPTGMKWGSARGSCILQTASRARCVRFHRTFR